MKLEDINFWHFLIVAVVSAGFVDIFRDYQKESTNREYIRNGFIQENINGKEVWVKKELKNKNE